MKNIILFTLGAVLLTLAYLKYTYWHETEVIGVFEKKEYFERIYFTLKSGASNVYKRTICSSISDFCVEGSGPYAYDSHGRVVVISSMEINYRLFFDKYTGERLKCVNCTSYDFLEKIEKNEVIWNRSGKLAVTTFQDKSQNRHVILLINDVGHGLEVNEIASIDFSGTNIELHELQYSPDEDNIAWYACNPDCTLWQYDITTSLFTKFNTVCPYNSYLDITWYGEVAKPEFYWGASERDMCFDQHGKPAFPHARKPYKH